MSIKFRKKPVVIEAVKFTEEYALDLFAKKVPPIFGQFTPSGSYHLENKIVYNAHILIETLEGKMRCDIGDWIIKGVKGEFYPCKPDIFKATYELVVEGVAAHAEGQESTPKPEMTEEALAEFLNSALVEDFHLEIPEKIKQLSRDICAHFRFPPSGGEEKQRG